MSTTTIIVFAVVIACVAGGLFLYFHKPGTTKNVSTPPVPGVWNIGPVINGASISVGVPAVMPKDGDGSYFDFPASPGHVDYVYRQTGKLVAGQVVTLGFSLEGAGRVKPDANSGAGPARLRLFLQRAGDDWSASGPYEHYRWWSTASVVLDSAGDLSISALLDPAQWTSVAGKSGAMAQADFAAALSNAAVIGFTFGATFAGHGVYADGPVRFRVRSFGVS